MKSPKKEFFLGHKELQQADRLLSRSRAVNCVQAVIDSDFVSLSNSSLGVYAGQSASVGA